MKYHELLELYKKKELSEEQREMVEQDIERYEAISEYLFEKEEENILQDSGEIQYESGMQLTKKEKNAADDFTKRVNRAIRRAFLKMGAAVCAVTLVVVLLILFVLPNIVSNFYYDPGRIVSENNYGGTTNQMSLDLAVYTELALPGTYRDDVQVEDRGYGNYNITIYLFFSSIIKYCNFCFMIIKIVYKRFITYPHSNYCNFFIYDIIIKSF